MAGCQRSNICLSSWPPIATEHELLKISKEKRKETQTKYRVGHKKPDLLI